MLRLTQAPNMAIATLWADALTFEGIDASVQRQYLSSAAGELPVHELARGVGRDVKRVHEDIGIPTNLGLLERTESGGVVCPYSSMHIDMYLKAA